MALETGVTYIEDLVTTNPVGATDNVDEGDDHIRNIKTAVKGSFPSLGAVAVTKTAAQINDLVDKSSVQTITGVKTLTSPVINGNAYLSTVVIDIGDWNMDTDVSKNVTHSLPDHTKIRTINVTIRNDADAVYSDFNTVPTTQTSVKYISATSTIVQLARDTGSYFNDPDYNATSYNRGWVTIGYVD